MKIPSTPVRLLVQLFCLLGIMSCQTRKVTTGTAPTNNHGNPEASSTGDLHSIAGSKMKM